MPNVFRKIAQAIDKDDQKVRQTTEYYKMFNDLQFREKFEKIKLPALRSELERERLRLNEVFGTKLKPPFRD